MLNTLSQERSAQGYKKNQRELLKRKLYDARVKIQQLLRILNVH